MYNTMKKIILFFCLVTVVHTHTSFKPTVKDLPKNPSLYELLLEKNDTTPEQYALEKEKYTRWLSENAADLLKHNTLKKAFISCVDERSLCSLLQQTETRIGKKMSFGHNLITQKNQQSITYLECALGKNFLDLAQFLIERDTHWYTTQQRKMLWLKAIEANNTAQLSFLNKHKKRFAVTHPDAVSHIEAFIKSKYSGPNQKKLLRFFS